MPERYSRPTGIEAIGEAPWGTHFCQLYGGKEDLWATLVSYFKAGLENRERCLWLTAPSLEVSEATRRLAQAVPELDACLQQGQIEIVAHTEADLPGAGFDPPRMLRAWREKLEQALSQGWAGLRLSTHPFWPEKSDWESLADYEAAVDSVVAPNRMLLLCAYPLHTLGAAEVAGLISKHRLALLKRDGGWQRLESYPGKGRARRALRASEERYWQLFGNLNEGFAVHEMLYDAEGRPWNYRFLEVNPAFERQTGLARGQVVGRTVREVLPNIEPFWIDIYAQVVETGVPARFDSFTGALGRHYEVLAFRPAPGRFAVLFLDITQRKRLEEKLAWLASYPERNPNPIIEADRAGQIHYLNPAALALFPDLPLQRLEHPWLSDWESIFAGFNPDLSRTHDRIIRVGQVVYRQSMYFVPETARVRVYGLDITEKQRAEEALRDSEARLKRSQEIAQLGSWELDLDSNRLTWSDEVYRIFGLQSQEFGASYEAFLEAVHPEDRAAVDAAYATSLQEGRDSYEIEHRVIRRSTGEIRIVHEKCQHLRDGESRIIRSMGMVHDITEMKRLERERARHLAEIEAANEAKDLFFNTLSHELRSPLAAMLNALELLRKPELSDPRRHRALEILDRNIRLQTRLIEDLLDLSRIMRGKVEIKRELLDLREVVRGAVEAVDDAARLAQLELRLVLAPDPVPVVGDPVRLGQVISNLLVNAIKFTEPGGRIEASASVDDVEALARVRDTGVGISSDLLPRIFEPFWQVDTSLVRAKAGLGIGLAVARPLAEVHGGRLEASSEGLGQGSEFTLRLPLHRSGPLPPEAPARTRARPARLRVLVIEDNPDLRESMQMLLEAMGHEPLAAVDGESGVAVARTELPQVVLVDIGLPDIDGYEVVRRLRGEATTRGLRVMALTGYATPEHRDRALEAGFDRHLAKPIDVRELELALAED